MYKIKRIAALFAALAFLSLFAACAEIEDIIDTAWTIDIFEESPDTEPDVVQNSEDFVDVTVLDVNHGDSILIRSGGQTMLIDCGEREYAEKVIKAVNENGSNYVDYLVLTHPHSDHIGAAAKVIQSLDIGAVIMPDVVHTTTTFEKTIAAIEDKNLSITVASVGDKYQLGDAVFTVLGPVSIDETSLNNCSVVLRMVLGKSSFLFMGDAEKAEEDEILSSGSVVKSVFYKVGHHGSDTSTKSKFLEAVSPSYAVVSVGDQYNLPKDSVMERIKSSGAEILRTDELGDVKIRLHADGSYAIGGN